MSAYVPPRQPVAHGHPDLQQAHAAGPAPDFKKVSERPAWGRLFLLVLLIVALGGISAWRSTVQVDRDMRDELLADAQLVAEAISLDRIEALTGTETDLNLPEYQRFKQQLATVRQFNRDCRFAYLVGRREDGNIFFFVDSEPACSKDCSPPGQIYGEASDALRSVFASRSALAPGPYADRWGTWVTGLIPLIDPHSGKVLAVLGMDVSAGLWRWNLARAAIPSLLAAVGVAVVLCTGAVLRARRRRLTGPAPRWLVHLEPALIVASGVVLTACTAWSAHANESRSRLRAFAQLAASRSYGLTHTLHDLRETQLEGLARFYTDSTEVTRDEFNDFAAYLTRNEAVHAWAWVSAVPAADKARFEQAARADGFPGFSIWQLDQHGQPTPASGRDIYYPVYAVAPLSDNGTVPGYDLGSELFRRLALEEAARTGLSTATEPIVLFAQPGGPKGMLVFRPVFADDDRGRLRGYALAAMKLETLLRSAGVDDSVSMQLSLLTQNAAPTLLAGNLDPDHQSNAFCMSRPIFAFGKPFLVTAHVGPGFLRLHPTRAGLITLLTGLALSGALAVVVGVTRQNRQRLERLVAERTAELTTSKQRFDQLAEQSGTFTWEIDVAGLFTYVSHVVEPVLGYRPEELVGRMHFYDLHPEAGRERFKAAAFAVIARAMPFHEVVNPIQARDGRQVWVSTNGIPLFHPDGTLRGYRGSDADVTVRKAAEDALAEQVRLTQAILDTTPGFLVLKDRNGVYREVNRAFCALLGRPRAEIVGKTDWDLFPPDEAEAHRAMDLRIMQTGEPESLDELLSGAGEARWLHINKSSVLDRNGACVGVLCSANDITERKVAELRLADESRRLANVIEGTHVGTWEWNVQTGETVFNERWAGMAGYTLAELSPVSIATWQALAHPDDLQASEELLRRHFEGELPYYDCECRVRHKRGHWVWVHDRGQVVTRTPDGRPLMMFGTHADITERKNAEAAIRESEEIQRLLMDSVDAGIVVVHPRTHVIERVNPAAARMFGAPRDQIVGQVCHSFLCPAEKGCCPVSDRGQQVERAERVMLRADGSHVPVLKSVRSVVINGQVKLLETFVDITERKRAEDALRESNAKLMDALERLDAARLDAEAASRSKSEFLANMSHEIRTPMTAILGFSEILAGSLSRPEDMEAIHTVRKNGELLLGIINDILDLSKIESGRMTVESLRCSPCEIVEYVVSLMRIRAQSKKISLDVEYVGPLPEAVRTDPVRLQQILINLLGNAVKFTEAGGVRLVLRHIPGDSPLLQFDIVDTGIGMTTEQAASIFEPFSQGDSTTTRRFGGTGLGLTISRRFAQLLGGDVMVVDTQPGIGTRFRATVSTGSLEGVPLLESVACALPVAPVVAPAPETLDCRVLLVEDGPSNQLLIRRLLGKAGADVTVAANGLLGIDAVRAAAARGTPFDVILMDMQMPVMDGYDATARLRAEGCLIPVIALTAHAMTGDRDKCLAAGCDDYASKPIDKARLIERVRHWSARTHEALQPAS